MSRVYVMQARNAANNGWVLWNATDLVDPTGQYAPGGPAAISAGTAFVLLQYGTRPIEYFIMQARNAAGTANLIWRHEGATPDTAGTDAPGAISAGTAFVLANYTGGAASVPLRDSPQAGATSANMIVWPLTYDEEDADGLNHLSRLTNVLGPHITPAGMLGNDFDSIYTRTTPSWQTAAASSVTMHVKAKIGAWYDGSARKVIMGLSTSTTTDAPKLEIAYTQDASATDQPQVVFRTNATTNATRRLNRAPFKFHFRVPELINGNVPSMQALCWLDATTLLFCVHESSTVTALYRVDMTTGTYTGKATTTVYPHIGSIHLRSNGQVWATDNTSGGAGYTAFEIDLARSFAGGTVVAAQTWDLGDLQTNGGLAFITVGGTEYILLQQYEDTGTAHLYVYLGSQIGTVINAVDRFKRFNMGLRCQDISVRASDGLLYISRNIRTGDVSSTGWIQSYNIATAIASSADGATLTAVASYPHAGEYAEGIDFNPSTDRCYVATEGLSAVSDTQGYSAVWSCSIPQVPETNAYLVDYNNSTHLLEIRLNERLMYSETLTITGVPAQINLGGHAPTGAGQGTATTVNGGTVISQAAIKDGPFTSGELAALAAGTFEAKTLTTFSVSLSNSGAESGATTGWTLESGAGTMTQRSASPAPYAGSQYFYGAGTGASIYRQRFDLATATGYSTDQVDEQSALAEMWGFATWQQCANSAETGSVGIRSNNTAHTQVEVWFADTSITPTATWRPRAVGLKLRNTSSTLLAREIDVFQKRNAGSGAVDIGIDDIAAVVYAQQRDTGTTVVSTITSCNDTSATNVDLSVVGANPLSVRGPLGTDFARAFGPGRTYAGALSSGPFSTFTGTNYTWECMMYVSAYPEGTIAVAYIIGNEAGADMTVTNNTLFRFSIDSGGLVTIFTEDALGANKSFTTTQQIPIGRWMHVRVRGLTNGANRDFTIHVTPVDTLTAATLGTGSLTLATSGTGGAVEMSQQNTNVRPFFGKLAYLRVSNIDRGTSDLVACATNPATGITTDASTTAFYSMQERT